FWIINEAKVDDFDAGAFEIFLHAAQTAFEPLLESFELRPVGVEADAEKSDARWFHGTVEIIRKSRHATSLICRKIIQCCPNWEECFVTQCANAQKGKSAFRKIDAILSGE